MRLAESSFENRSKTRKRAGTRKLYNKKQVKENDLLYRGYEV